MSGAEAVQGVCASGCPVQDDALYTQGQWWQRHAQDQWLQVLRAMEDNAETRA